MLSVAHSLQLLYRAVVLYDCVFKFACPKVISQHTGTIDRKWITCVRRSSCCWHGLERSTDTSYGIKQERLDPLKPYARVQMKAANWIIEHSISFKITFLSFNRRSFSHPIAYAPHCSRNRWVWVNVNVFQKGILFIWKCI